MKNVIRTGVVSLAGAVGVGVIALGTGSNGATTAPDADNVVLSKREQNPLALIHASDEDNDDDRSNDAKSRDAKSRADRPSRGTNAPSRDQTRSRVAAKAPDRDVSRDVPSRDWTQNTRVTRDVSRNSVDAPRDVSRNSVDASSDVSRDTASRSQG